MDLIFVTHVILILFLAIVTFYDLKSLIIPDGVIIAGVTVGLVLLFLNKDNSLITVILASCVMGGLGLGISLLTKGGLGLGDVKLMATLAIYMGLWNVISVALVASVLSGVVGLFLLVAGKANKKTFIPFAPFVLVSTVVLLIVGQLG